MSKDFSKNIGPKKTSRKSKVSDADIEKVLGGREVKKKQKGEQTTFTFRIPVELLNELKDYTNRTGVSMSSIIKQGIVAELKRLKG